LAGGSVVFEGHQEGKTPVNENRLRVIDADGHVVEPVEMWEDYLELEYRHRRPKLVEDSWGTPRILMENMFFPKGRGYDCGNTDGWLVGSGTSRFRGGSDPHARIQDMDADGPTDMAVLFPSLATQAWAIRDPGFEAALCRAYNDWIADYAGAYPERLKAVIAPPLNRIDAAIAEIRRCRNKSPVFVGIVIPSNIHGRNLQQPELYPLWQEAQELDLPVCTHISTGSNIPAAGGERFDNFFQTHCVTFPFEAMINVLDFVTGGVLELHPHLRVAFMESGIGWVPYWMDRLDEHYERRAHEVPLCKKPPSEYMKSNQCYFSSDPDEKTIPMAVEHLGEDRILYASDYPHWDSRFPHTVHELLKQEMASTAKAKILGGNAMQLFKLA